MSLSRSHKICTNYHHAYVPFVLKQSETISIPSFYLSFITFQKYFCFAPFRESFSLLVQEVYDYLADGLSKLAVSHGQRLLDTKHNPISLGTNYSPSLILNFFSPSQNQSPLPSLYACLFPHPSSSPLNSPL